MRESLSFSLRPENIIRFLLYLSMNCIIAFGLITIAAAGDGVKGATNNPKAVVRAQTTVNQQVMASNKSNAATNFLLLMEETAATWDQSEWDNARWGS